MSKIKHLMETIEELRECSASMVELADELESLFSTHEVAEQKEEAPQEKPAIKFEELRGKLADISRAGHTDEVKALIKKYGVDRLSAVELKDYEALMKDAEALYGK